MLKMVGLCFSNDLCKAIISSDLSELSLAVLAVKPRPGAGVFICLLKTEFDHRRGSQASLTRKNAPELG